MSDANSVLPCSRVGCGTEPGARCLVELIAVSFHYIFVTIFEILSSLNSFNARVLSLRCKPATGYLYSPKNGADKVLLLNQIASIPSCRCS